MPHQGRAAIPKPLGETFCKTVWAPRDANGQPQLQEESGEDWWYDVKVSRNSQGTFEGYVTCGYTNWNNTGIFETNGCLNKPTDPKLECGDFETVGNLRGRSRGTIARFSINGRMAWCKPFYSTVFFSVIQAQDGGYVAVGMTESTQPLDPNRPLYYNPGRQLSGPINSFSPSSRGSGFARKMVVVKVDQHGNIVWNALYGMETFTGNGVDAALRDTRGFDLVETDHGFRIVGAAEIAASGSNGQMFIVDVSPNGDWLDGRLFPMNNVSGQATAIARDGSDYIVVGKMLGPTLKAVAIHLGPPSVRIVVAPVVERGANLIDVERCRGRPRHQLVVWFLA